jgi:hypothetical protein
VGGNGPAPPLHPSKGLRPCQNTQSTQQTSLMTATLWSRVQVPTPMRLSSDAASGTTTRKSILMSLPNSGCARMQSRQYQSCDVLGTLPESSLFSSHFNSRKGDMDGMMNFPSSYSWKTALQSLRDPLSISFRSEAYSEMCVSYFFCNRL